VKGGGGTTVWVVRLRPDGELGWRRAAECLNDEDRARSAALRHEDDRRRLAVSRLALRELVRRLLPESPTPVVVEHPSHRAPRVAGGALQLSLAHSGHRILCAASRSPVGVDVEVLPGPTPSAAVLQRYLSPGERGSLVALSPKERAGAFLRIWVRKEAVVKAAGWGMDADLQLIDVRASSLSLPDLDSGLCLTDVALEGGAVAAIASSSELALAIEYPNEDGRFQRARSTSKSD
jgi:4'-phosphopantetheinyl transferase